MDDMRAVLDTIGVERVSVLGESEGGPLSMLFAASFPARANSLILCGAEVKERRTEDWPRGEATDEEFEESLSKLAARWGEGGGMKWLAPDRPSGKEAEAWLGRLQVHAMTPGDAEAYMRMAFEIDVRDLVPTIRTPALILHREGDRICHVENARFLAKHMPNARYIELPGRNHVPWIDGDDIVNEIREFITGVREPIQPDSVLATVLFTDIVDSTKTAHAAGDQRWRSLIEGHHAIVRRELERFRGQEINTTGDGFLARFDGPARAIRCAKAIVEAVNGLGIEVRAGVHTGECVIANDTLSGVAVHIGARISSLAGTGQVLVSRTVCDLVAGSGIEFRDRGTHRLKGVHGTWRIFEVA